MNENIYYLCEEIIKEEDDLFVSTHKLYELVNQEKEKLKVDFDEFLNGLRQNSELFTVIELPVEDATKELKLDDTEFNRYGGPYIHLASDPIDPGDYAEFLKLRIDSIIENIQNLYEYKHDQGLIDENQSEKFQDVLERSYSIREQLDNMIKEKSLHEN